MSIESLNPRVMALHDSHPAKRFLSAFIECQNNCVGLELDLDEPVDQAWKSITDGRDWAFSGFAYAFLAIDIELDRFLTNGAGRGESEKFELWDLPRLRSLMNECTQAARQSGNSEILELTDEVLEMLSLWDDYLSLRKATISNAHDRSGREQA